jgi:2-succinyl-5-enolpyruvyl-6-hydroxy-3-cyclohexene-1-carboxylate synthase
VTKPGQSDIEATLYFFSSTAVSAANRSHYFFSIEYLNFYQTEMNLQQLFQSHRVHCQSKSVHQTMILLQLNLVFEEPLIEQHKQHNNNDCYYQQRKDSCVKIENMDLTVNRHC